MKNFIKALQTEEYTYYINLKECDPNANTQIYNNEGRLLSTNIHAYNSFIQEAEDVLNGKKDAVYVDNEVLENIKLLLTEDE